ncbi:copper homeostasis periplasmic binding protein CopC [Methylocapsa polymorpha]|uniref:Copper homeostasis periplasmic binding protein CopC n=1 Tax=Methylocapsa polymorpha TaxID=3080828 RepID=A0ABZ0HLC7_9HYPH|nr:copper homeostasis periplasmic binding protein CopC [Methylocapsa sp. RX1]
MQQPLKILTATGLACILATTAAFAHAFLDTASPGVGATVSGAPSEVRLSFSQNIVLAFSGVQISAAGGGPVPAGKATLAGPNVLSVRLGHALKPGAYVVNWHVVSVDTHPTSGTYHFTVAP